MMNIDVLGANGRTEQHEVQFALARGMNVTAIVRSEDKSPVIESDKLTTAVGDPCDPFFLAEIFQGKDAVISTLGGRIPTRKATSIYYRAAQAIVDAALKTGLKRILVTSTALLFPPRTLSDRILPLIVRHTAQSAKRMEKILKEVELDWTFTRCGFLTDNDKSAYRTEVDRLPEKGSSVSRADLVNFLIDAINDPKAVHQTISVSGAKQ